MKELIGRTIISILVSDSEITFVTETGKVSLRVSGDCCSNSYFYEISDFNKVKDKPIVSVEEIDLDVEKGTENRGIKYPEYIQSYGFRINAQSSSTELKEGVSVDISNSMLVVFRNNSNGYYGGYCGATDEHLELGGEGVTEVKDSWITE